MIPVSAYAQGIGLAGGAGPMTAAVPQPQMASSVSPLAPKSEIYFNPHTPSRHAEKQQPWYSWLGGNFNLNSFFTFLPMLRAFGYTFDIMYTPIITWMQSNHNTSMPKALSGAPMTLGERVAHYAFGSKEIPQSQNGTTISKLNAERSFYQGPINKVEAVAFTGLALVSATSMLKTLLKDARLAVGAEMAKDPDTVTLFDLRASDNPMVATQVDKALWQVAIRTTAGALFAKGLQWGVLGNVLAITTERTVFYHPTAFDILQKSINNVQINNLGQEAKADLVDGLVKTLQAEQLDHRRQVYSRQDIDSIRPTLELVAEDIIDKKFGFAGALYVMGAGVLQPGNAEQTRINYEHVRDVGVKGVAKEGLWMRQHQGVPTNKVWEAKLEMARKGKDYVAESATREELLRHRQQILARGPLLPTGRRSDPAEQGGSGVIVL